MTSPAFSPAVLLVGRWEADPNDNQTLNTVGAIALQVADGFDSEMLQIRLNSYSRLRLRHSWEEGNLCLRYTLSPRSPVTTLSVSFDDDASTAWLTNADSKVIKLRRLGLGEEFWQELSDEERQERLHTAKGSIDGYLGAAAAAFLKPEEPN